MESKDIIPVKMRQVVRGDRISMPDGGTLIVQKVEFLSKNIRLTFRDNTTLMRGKNIRMKVRRDLAFYERSRKIDDKVRRFITKTPNRSDPTRYGTPFRVGQSRVNR